MLQSQLVPIMIVEDDPGHSKLIEKNLRRGGLNNPIKTFENGQLALDYLNRQGNFKDHPVHQTLLLLDINMPVMNGLELLRILKAELSGLSAQTLLMPFGYKQNIKFREIPVIVLTSTDDQREIDECYSLGCNLYVPKPVEFNRFTEAMRKLGMMIELIAVPSIK